MESKMYTAFSRLNEILDTLRKECPWDREQTLLSLRYLTIEEVHELSEAIVALEVDGEDEKRISDFKKELGDLAMHILFYCKIAEERGLFSTADVYNAISDKLVARHPFIYKQDDYHGESWEQIKMREGRRNVLGGVPSSLPSLVKAIRMQEKVAGMLHSDPQASVVERAHNLEECLTADDIDADAFGDLLFGLIDWARSRGINADDALMAANHRFEKSHTND